MRLGRALATLACLLAAALADRRLRQRIGLLHRIVLGQRPEPSGAAEERVPQRRGQDPRRSARSRRRDAFRRWSSRPRPRSSTRGRTATRSASSSEIGPRSPDAEVALYFAKVPNTKDAQASDEFGEAAGTPSAKKAEEKALEQPAVGPVPGRDRNARDPAGLPRPDDYERP